MYHNCIHGSGDLVRRAHQVGTEVLCSGVRLGNYSLRGGDGDVIYSM